MPIAPLRKKYLGEILLIEGLITREQLRQALAEQQDTKEKLGVILLRHGYVSESDLLRALSVCYGLTLVQLSDIKIEEEALKAVSEKIARRFVVMPLSRKGDTLKLAMADPSNVVAIDDIEAETKLKVSIVLASEKEIKEAIERYYAGSFISANDLPEEAVEELSSDDAAELSKDDYAAVEVFLGL
jgi:type IV pilus assembly protein PilB